MLKWLLGSALASVLCVTSAPPVLAKRVALVVGNSNYERASVLPNPLNDAKLVADQLRQLGFEVLLETDLDKRAFDLALVQFAQRLTGATAALFFYAGHGLQVAGQNYLVPTDAKVASEAALDFELVRLDVVQRNMERQSSTNLILLDACRDNPLARNLARSMGTRSSMISRGLAAVESGVGTLISFSTQPGNVALDGSGKYSPYANALAKHIAKPGEDVSSILIDVRKDVMAATENQQVPWEHSALRDRFYFLSPAPAAAEPASKPPARYGRAAEIELWRTVREMPSEALYGYFLEQFPDGLFAPAARIELDRLRALAGVSGASPQERGSERGEPGEAGSQVARLADDEKIGTADDQSERELVVELQRALKSRGCYRGQVDGIWGPASGSALRRAIGELAEAPLSSKTLSQVMSIDDDACRSSDSGGTVAGTKRKRPSAATRKARTTTKAKSKPSSGKNCRIVYNPDTMYDKSAYQFKEVCN